jgi:hypothetical protein
LAGVVSVTRAWKDALKSHKGERHVPNTPIFVQMLCDAIDVCNSQDRFGKHTLLRRATERTEEVLFLQRRVLRHGSFSLTYWFDFSAAIEDGHQVGILIIGQNRQSRLKREVPVKVIV